MFLNKRMYKRYNCKVIIRIYSSILSGSYTADLKNISQGGAYVLSGYVLPRGEIITYEILNESYKPILSGDAIVCHSQKAKQKRASGYGIQFFSKINNELIDKFVEN